MNLDNDQGTDEELCTKRFVKTKTRTHVECKLRPKKKANIDKTTNEELYRLPHVNSREDWDTTDDDQSTDKELYCASLPDVNAPSENESINEPIMISNKRKRKLSNVNKKKESGETIFKKVYKTR